MAKTTSGKNEKTGDDQRRTNTPVSPWKFQTIGAFLCAPEVALTAFLVVVAFVGITFCYPFPATLTDTGQYVDRAAEKIIGIYRPFGYSWFLLQVHRMSGTVRALTLAQGLLHGASLICFVRAVVHLFPDLSRPYRWLLVAGLSLNPVTVYLVNTVLSDSLFTSLTLLWLASGTVLIRRRSWLLAAFHLAVMYLAMQVRYAGIIYPAVSALVFLMGKGRVPVRALVAAVPILIGVFFYFSTKKTMDDYFGVDTFSGFAGWQAANNAMHILPYAKIQPGDIPDPETRRIFEFVRLFGDTIYPPAGQTTSAFMWEMNLPLKQYFLQYVVREKPGWKYANIWLYAGTKYERFGNYFIRRYPLLYARYFFWPNLKDAIYPPLGVLARPQSMAANIPCRKWFGLSAETDTAARYPLYELQVNGWLPAANAGMCLLDLLLLCCAIITRRRRCFDAAQVRVLIFWTGFAGIFVAFNAYATPIEIRYLAPVSLVLIVLAVTLFGYLRWPAAKVSEPENQAPPL